MAVSNNRCTFAVAFKERDLAQLVAHTSGGREVAGSSPVIPTFSEVSGWVPIAYLCFRYDLSVANEISAELQA